MTTLLSALRDTRLDPRRPDVLALLWRVVRGDRAAAAGAQLAALLADVALDARDDLAVLDARAAGLLLVELAPDDGYVLDRARLNAAVESGVAEGLTDVEIATRVGWSRRQVRRIRVDLGLLRRGTPAAPVSDEVIVAAHRAFVATHSRPPTAGELGERCKLRASTVLERTSRLRREDGVDLEMGRAPSARTTRRS